MKLAGYLSLGLLLAALAACSISPHNGGVAASAYSPADLHQLAQAPAPEGVDPQLYRALRAELARQLAAVPRSASTPPQGEDNRVPDLGIEVLPANQAELSWTQWIAGDYDQNGKVGISDLTPLAMHFGEAVADAPLNFVIDGDGNGVIGIGDITPIAMYFQSEVTGYTVRGADNITEPTSSIEDVLCTTAIVENGVVRFHYVLDSINYEIYEVVPFDSAHNEGIPSDPTMLGNGGALSDWPMEDGNSQHTGCISGDLPTYFAPDWEYECESGDFFRSPPVVDASGSIYAVSYSFNPSKLYAISPDGTLRWVKELSGESSGSPTVLASGDVVVSALGTLSCYSSDGVLLWERTFDTAMLSGAVVDGSKNIFVGAAAGTSIPNARIYCVSRLGKDIWSFDLQGVEVVTPALDTRGCVYVGDEAGTVYSIDEDGLERWRWDAPGPIHAPVTVDSYSRLFFTCENASAASAVCLATIGTFLWQSDLPNVMHRSLRFADAGRLIAGSIDMVCLDGSGLEIWRIDQAGSLIITTQDGILTYDGVTTSLLALNFDGAELWRYALPRAAEAPPVLLRNGRALIFGRNPATMAGVLMALKAAPAPMP